MSRKQWLSGEKTNKLEWILKNYKSICELMVFEWDNKVKWAPCGECLISVYENGKEKIACVLESPNNTGLSVTNGAESLWQAVEKRFGHISIKLETYDGITFDEVTIINGMATWERFYEKKQNEAILF